MGNDYQKGLSAIPGSWINELQWQNQRGLLNNNAIQQYANQAPIIRVYTYSLFGFYENKLMVTHSSQSNSFKNTNWVTSARN